MCGSVFGTLSNSYFLCENIWHFAIYYFREKLRHGSFSNLITIMFPVIAFSIRISNFLSINFLIVTYERHEVPWHKHKKVIFLEYTAFYCFWGGDWFLQFILVVPYVFQNEWSEILQNLSFSGSPSCL